MHALINRTRWLYTLVCSFRSLPPFVVENCLLKSCWLRELVKYSPSAEVSSVHLSPVCPPNYEQSEKFGAL